MSGIWEFKFYSFPHVKEDQEEEKDDEEREREFQE